MYGVIEGTTDFLSSQNCVGGLMNTINSSFRMIDNIALYDPSKTMKFAMSSNNLLESTNVIYAYCDFSHLYNEIAKLTNWRKWE